MADYSKIVDDLISGKPQEPKKEVKTSTSSIYDEQIDALINGREFNPDAKVKRNFEETGAISTITGKPVLKFQYSGAKSAGILTHAKAGTVDDINTKIKIYAQERFPNDPNAFKRYGIKDGEIVFMGDDGNLHSETGDMPLDRAGKFVGEEIANAPAAILGGIGATGGPILAGLGAAGGEGIRKTIGSLVYDEPQSTGGNVVDMATMGTMGAVSEKAGKLVTGALNRAGAKRGGKLAVAAGRDRGFIDPLEVARIEAKGKSFGVDLLPPQTSGSRELIGKTKWLRDRPGTADIINPVLEKQNVQAQKATGEFIEKMGGYKSPLKVGEDLVSASKKAVEEPINIRREKASPIYKKAFSETTVIDIDPVLKKLNTLSDMSPEGGASKKAITKIKKMIFNDKTGPETRLEVLDNVKKEIDAMLEGPEGASIHKDVKFKIGQIKDELTETMDKASPEYARARKIFSEESEAVNKTGKKTLASNLAKLENDEVVNAHKRLIQGTFSHPETVLKARKQIEKYDPEAWRSTVGLYLQDQFNKSKKGDVMNFGGKLYNNIVKDTNTREILRAAMDKKEFNTLMDLSDVLNRASWLAGKESATAERLMINESLRGQMGSKVGRLMQTDLTAPMKKIGQWMDGLATEKDARLLADAMVSEKVSKQLQKMKQLSPGQEKWTRQLVILSSIVAGDQARRKVKFEYGKSDTKVKQYN